LHDGGRLERASKELEKTVSGKNLGGETGNVGVLCPTKIFCQREKAAKKGSCVTKVRDWGGLIEKRNIMGRPKKHLWRMLYGFCRR